MTRPHLAFFWAGAFVLIGLSLFCYHERSAGRPTATLLQPGDKLMPGLDSGKIKQITINSPKGKVSLVEGDGKWVVKERENFPAERGSVNELLRNLVDLKIAQSIEAEQPEYWARFGVDPKTWPQWLAAQEKFNAQNSSQDDEDEQLVPANVDLCDAKGMPLQKLIFGNISGNSNRTESSDPLSLGGRFVRLEGDNSGVYIVSDSVPGLSSNPKDWIASSLLAFQRIYSLELTAPNDPSFSSWKMTRASDEAEFVLDNPAPGEELNYEETFPLKSYLSYAQLEEAPSAEQAKKLAVEPIAVRVLSATTFDGFSYKLTFTPTQPALVEGFFPHLKGEFYLLRFSVEAKIPEARLVSPGESTQDAKKNTANWAELRKELLAKLEKEKSISARTYLVTEGLAAPILKSRVQLTQKSPLPENPRN